MYKSSLAPHLVDQDNEKLISWTKDGLSERKGSLFASNLASCILLALSLLLSCLEIVFVSELLTSQRGNNGQNFSKISFQMFNSDRSKPTAVDSYKLLVSLMTNERIYRQHANKRTQVVPTVQRYLTGDNLRLGDYSSSLIASKSSKDVTYGNFQVNPEFITIPKKGLYEVTTIVTIKFTRNFTEATHALYRQSGNVRVPMMQRSLSVRPDVMAFQQSVLKDSFYFQRGDKLCLFVSRMYGVSEKTTPISVRYIE